MTSPAVADDLAEGHLLPSVVYTTVTEEYDAIVYDLDGTLVQLAVDWQAAHEAVAQNVRKSGVSVGSESLWDLLDRAHSEGFAADVEAVLASHERGGARDSVRLPTADELPRSVPVGVCSLNAESACTVALERHGLDRAVDTVVGRDTVETYKPDPEPLLTAVRSLSATPEQTLFVGDTERDELTAERAGTDFRYVEARAVETD